MISARDGKPIAAQSGRLETENQLLDWMTGAARAVATQLHLEVRTDANADAALSLERPRSRRSTPVATWVFGGTSIAAAGAGLYFGLTARERMMNARSASQTEFTAMEDSARQTALIADVCYAAAGVSLGAAAMIYLLRGPDTRPTAVSIGISPNGAMLSFTGAVP